MIEKIIEEIPDYQEFLTTKEMDENSLELANKYPDIVKVKSLGKSRQGHDIYCLKIGEGSKNAVMFGCPHPNEPMGAMMLEYLSEKLASDDEFRKSFDYTWYLIKSIDIDGTKLNENWFKGDLTISKYARNFFRPAGYEQVEWTYPIDYKTHQFNSPLPETELLMNLIEEVDPIFVYSLHNAGFGGTYWYASKDYPELWDSFYQAAKKQAIPLHLGEPEVNYVTPFAPAIFPMIDTNNSYDYYEKFGEGDPSDLVGEVGTSTSGWMQDNGYDGVVLVTELPYFYDSKIENNDLLDKTRKDSYLEGLDYRYQETMVIDEVLKPIKDLISEDNPFYKMIEVSYEYTVKGYETEKNFAESNEEYQEKVKVSEAFDNYEISRFGMQLSWGLAVRTAEHELEKGNAKNQEILKDTFEKLEAAFDERAKKVEELIDYQLIPIKKLVAIQLESGLLLMEHLQEKEN